MLRHAIHCAKGRTDRVTFRVLIWDGRRHNGVNLWSQCGPGDQGEPVITIMLEGED